ncbi:hypothetical protein BU25DRAFT_351820 [Macroventuria anomochaeta]|uniref:Uncharacterized protein n=1 Tax=Macroventuria anomochaeta TaxID=301207 RepID=A0ACB6RNF3_9PLEO|nr:uncharacterized protein BU25DRAFT_351820 [Macroventuria anomochaeta]KAF2622643.1 hypothetical protein BU25DRAFT_351820 [Macroventuria anomochaeta]
MLASNGRSETIQQKRQRIYDAIDSATPDRLRAILKKVVNEQPGGLSLVGEELLLRKGQSKAYTLQNRPNGAGHGDEEQDSSDYSDADGDDAPRSKRKSTYSRQRFEHCVQCEKEYDVTQNGPRSCQWHDGDDEVDEEQDFWADHDEDCHGEIDTPEMRKLFPEGFRWTCCNKLGNDKGCKITPHRPDRSKRVRR